MSKVAVIGAGYVGLTTAACFAHLGHEVFCADIDAERVEQLKRGEVPILEAGLEQLVAEGIKSGRLHFVLGAARAAEQAEFSYLSVPTPQGHDGRADLSYIEAAAREIGPVLPPEAVVVNKSTVPVGSTRVVEHALGRSDVYVVSNPEFLREGSAVSDFLHPDRVVIGSEDQSAAIRVASLYVGVPAPLMVTDPASAETIKYASNAFLATKISFINELADLCELVGADVKEVAAGMGYDARIGRHFLDAGLGWGGSCFPKDVEALAFMAKEKGLEPAILNSVMDVNYMRRKGAVKSVEAMVGGSLKGKTVGLLGLAFKPNTDDMRDAPAITIAETLLEAGAKVRAYDPVAMEVARPILPAVDMFDEPYKLAEGCDALMVVTEWNEFKQLDLDKVKSLLKTPVIYDGRNIYEPGRMKGMGFTYRAIGR